MMAAVIGGSASAADTASGSKNFAVPTSVPNYFSNESGPLQGPTSETRRGQLYMNQTYGTSSAAAAVVAVPRAQQHVAMAEPRGRTIRGRVAYDRRGRVVAGRRTETRGRPIYRAVAHERGRVEHVAARAHTIAHHPTQVSSAHHRGRG